MGKRKPIRVGDVVFPTKKAAAKEIQAILHRNPPGVPLAPDDELFMRDVLALHPEYAIKRGAGVRAIHTQLESGHGTRCFVVVRTDGSKTDFSFRSCLTPPTHAQNVRAALRTEVADQVMAYKSRHFRENERCPVSGDELTWDTIHVDHVTAFEDLVAQFLTTAGLSVETIAVNATSDGDTLTLLADRALAERWSQYHASHAQLRLVSRRANLSLLRRATATP